MTCLHATLNHCVPQARHRQIREWQVLYAVQAFGDKWRSLERRKDRQRQAFDAAIELATDPDFQQALEDAREQLDQAMSNDVCVKNHMPCSRLPKYMIPSVGLQ